MLAIGLLTVRNPVVKSMVVPGITPATITSSFEGLTVSVSLVRPVVWLMSGAGLAVAEVSGVLWSVAVASVLGALSMSSSSLSVCKMSVTSLAVLSSVFVSVSGCASVVSLGVVIVPVFTMMEALAEGAVAEAVATKLAGRKSVLVE